MLRVKRPASGGPDLRTGEAEITGMAKFLLTVWSFPGHINPTMAIAQALRARGHEVAFYTGARVRAVVEGEGFRYFPFTKVDEERIYARLRLEFSLFGSAWDQLCGARHLTVRLREWLLDTIPQQVEDLETVLAEWWPDVLVCETAFWGPLLVLHETWRVPVAVFSTVAACLLPGPDAPAYGRGLPRPRNWAMRLRSRLERQVVSWLSAGFRAEVNALRRRYGLPPLATSVTEVAGRMPLYLVPSTPEFDYERRDLPPSVHY